MEENKPTTKFKYNFPGKQKHDYLFRFFQSIFYPLNLYYRDNPPNQPAVHLMVEFSAIQVFTIILQVLLSYGEILIEL